MENPQRENGHVEIATEIAEKFQMYRLSGQEWQIVWVVFRKTWGWNKKEDMISYSQFMKLTGMTRSEVIRAIAKLVTKKLLVVNKEKIINIYRFNKLYSQWGGYKKVTTDRVVTKKSHASDKKVTTLVTKKLPSEVTKQSHTIDTPTIDTNTINTITIDKVSKDTTIAQQKMSNREINQMIAFFKVTLKLPLLDGSEKENRKYAWLLLKKFKTLEQCHVLIRSLEQHKFWSTKVTSMESLYRNAVNIMSSARDKRLEVTQL